MQRVRDFVIRNWMPIAGIGTLLIAADVLHNPIADLQDQLTKQKSTTVLIWQQFQDFKALQPNAREIQADEDFRTDVRKSLTALSLDVAVIKSRIGSGSAGLSSTNGEAFDPPAARSKAGDIH